MSKKLISAVVAVGLSVCGVSAFAIEKKPAAQSPSMNRIVEAAKKPVVIELTPVHGVVGEVKTITLKVKSTDGKPLKGAEVYLRFNGIVYQCFAMGDIGGMVAGGAGWCKFIMDENGSFSFPLALKPTTVQEKTYFHLGTNTMEAEFIGNTATDNGKYLPGKATTTITITESKGRP